MVVNFRAREIIQGACKLTRTLTLILKKIDVRACIYREFSQTLLNIEKSIMLGNDSISEKRNY